MTNTLKQHAQSLRLSGLLNSLDLRLQEAEANRLPYAQFLELIFQDEINVRHQRLLARRRKAADFREPRSLEHFDFGFNPTINRGQIYELAASIRAPAPGRTAGRPAWRRQKSSGPGHRSGSPEGRLCCPLSLDLRSGARATLPGDPGRRGSFAQQISQARSAHH